MTNAARQPSERLAGNVPDQRFPVHFPKLPPVDDERFLLIVKNGFPKKLSLKVLQHQIKVPYRSLQDESCNLDKGRNILPPLPSKLVNSNSEPILSQWTSTREGKKRGELTNNPLRRSEPLLREATFYPRGWPRTKTGVNRLKKVRVGVDDHTGMSEERDEERTDSNSKVDHRTTDTEQRASDKTDMVIHSSVPVDTDMVTLEYVQEIPPQTWNHTASVDTVIEGPRGAGANEYTNISAHRKDITSAHVDISLPLISSDLNTSLTSLHKSNDMPTNKQTENLPKNQQSDRTKQMKLPALNTKSKEYANEEKANNKRLSHEMPRVVKRRRGKRETAGESVGEITSRKPVISNPCQLQDLIQTQLINRQKPVDPYSVFLKYHAKRPVIDSSTYYRHARKAPNVRKAG